MANKKKKNHFITTPIEKHDTAAWQNTNNHENISGVIKPDEIDAINAKEYVDTNQK